MGNGYGMGFGGIFMWLFWLLVVVGVVWMVKMMVGNGKKDQQADRSALDILKERYARGEINQQEFEQKRRDLEG